MTVDGKCWFEVTGKKCSTAKKTDKTYKCVLTEDRSTCMAQAVKTTKSSFLPDFLQF